MGRIQPVRLGWGAISVIFGGQVSLGIHYSKRDENNFTTLLWQNNGQQNGFTTRKLFSELYKITVNVVIFVGFRRIRSTKWPPFDPTLIVRSRRTLDFLHSRFTRAHQLEPELPCVIKYFLKRNSYQTESFLKQWICI